MPAATFNHAGIRTEHIVPAALYPRLSEPIVRLTVSAGLARKRFREAVRASHAESWGLHAYFQLGRN
jgi:hypothetical protein